MKKKIEYTKSFLKCCNPLICPICKEQLTLNNSILKCANNHTFDLKKNGSIFLLNTSRYVKSKLYTKELFLYRRKFIEDGFYKDLYPFLQETIKRQIKQDSIILDVGCGESTHTFKILKDINIKWIGFDYAKEAIDLSTDYLNGNNLFIVGDVNNIPIAKESVDCIIDFLSPFNMDNVSRVLKKDGIFIKIIPDELYLYELRELFKIKKYTPNNYDNMSLKIIEQKKFIRTYNIDKIEHKKYLCNFTPLTWYKNYDYEKIEKITIALKVLILKKEKV